MSFFELIADAACKKASGVGSEGNFVFSFLFSFLLFVCFCEFVFFLGIKSSRAPVVFLFSSISEMWGGKLFFLGNQGFVYWYTTGCLLVLSSVTLHLNSSGVQRFLSLFLVFSSFFFAVEYFLNRIQYTLTHTHTHMCVCVCICVCVCVCVCLCGFVCV